MIPKEQILNIQSSIDVCKKDLIDAINNYGECDVHFNMVIEVNIMKKYIELELLTYQKEDLHSFQISLMLKKLMMKIYIY